MKKRDLTKLALMGIAIGLCGGQIQADDLIESSIAFEEPHLALGCGPNTCKVPSQNPQNPQQPQQNQQQPQQNNQQQKQSSGQYRNDNRQMADAWSDDTCGEGNPNLPPKKNR